MLELLELSPSPQLRLGRAKRTRRGSRGQLDRNPPLRRGTCSFAHEPKPVTTAVAAAVAAAAAAPADGQQRALSGATLLEGGPNGCNRQVSTPTRATVAIETATAMLTMIAIVSAKHKHETHDSPLSRSTRRYFKKTRLPRTP